MKLVNPTDAELNAAFAENVAGWKLVLGKTETANYWCDFEDETLRLGTFNLPKWTASADAVLPWLEKCVVISVHKKRGEQWRVYLVGVGATARPSQEGIADTFAKAAVIALLRAHGVEVVFT